MHQEGTLVQGSEQRKKSLDPDLTCSWLCPQPYPCSRGRGSVPLSGPEKGFGRTLPFCGVP